MKNGTIFECGGVMPIYKFKCENCGATGRESITEKYFPEHDPVVNPNPPSTTWAGGVGSLALGMNRSAGSSNVDFWNNTDPNNGGAALTLTDRGFNWRNFRDNGGSCLAQQLMTLDGNGTLTLNQVTGAGGRVNSYGFNTISDQRVKRNIQPLKNIISSKLVQLRPVSYNYSKINYDPLHHLEILSEVYEENETGFLAQEVYKIFPQAVYKPIDESKELWAIDYAKLTPLLVKGFQEQQQLLNALSEELIHLKQNYIKNK
ncbi:MAG: tail fiber domain-containing protein [Ferruginibacter sp.]